MDNKHKTIVVVDDNLANLKTVKGILSEIYGTFTAPSAERMFALLERTIPDLILLDVEMPEMNGYEAIKLLKENPKTQNIPVIFLTALSGSGNELEGLSLGAVDYIFKPFSPELLLKRIELQLLVTEQTRELKNYNDNLRQMVEEKTENVVHLQMSILQTIADLVERRDGETGGHITRTQRYIKIMLDALIDLGLYADQIDESWDIDLVILSSQLHDVGKIGIDDNILRKPGPLNPDEFEIIKQHAVYGAEIIDRMIGSAVENDFMKYAKVFAETHHEKWDGTGYPHGLKGNGIPLLGRLMAVADVYDALTSTRPYKNAFPHEEAVQIIVGGKGTAFDPLLMDVFEQVSDEFVSAKDENL
ncbi:two-component system response regulator [Synergistales bacterium]|nr:two-component system response regulator [Synergistales bacterium]